MDYFKLMFHNSSVGMAIISKKGRVIETNGALLEILGFSEEEIKKIGFWEYTHPDDIKTEFPLFLKVSKGDISHYKINKRYVHGKTGEVIHGTAFASKNENGEIVLGITVNERKQTEALRMVSKYKRLFETSPSLIAVLKRNARFDKMNKSWIKFLGPKDPGSLRLFDIIHDDDRDNAKSCWKSLTFEDDNTQTFIHRFKNSKSQYRWVSWKVSYDKSHNIVYFIGEDISDIIARERELERVNYDLERFIYAASHDLQQPLRIISVYADLIQYKASDDIDDKLKSYLLKIAKNSKDAVKLIRDLLDFSRAGRVYDKTEVRLCAVIDDALTLYEDSLKDASVKVNCPDCLVLSGSKSHLLSLMGNLVSNSIKFKNPQKELTLEFNAVKKENQILLEVKDNGRGMPEGVGETLFEPFKRGNHRNISGSGIGLAICKKVVESHDGKIWYDSTERQGTSFWMSFPLT